MEVHKHPHHITHKKKWSEYLLEFFMLFLAVFLGFIAENIREHSVEQRRGKEYINSFVQDLKKDTNQYRFLVRELIHIDSVTKDISGCYDTISRNVTSTNCLNNIISNLTGFTDFIYTDRTMQQLKNSGGLRLIADKQVADSIIAYDALVRQELIHQEVLEVLQQKATDAIKSMIDFTSYVPLYQNSRGGPAQPVHTSLTKKSQPDINRFFNELITFKLNLDGQKKNLVALQKKAENLITFIENKYPD